MTMQRNQSPGARHPLSKYFGPPPEISPIEVKVETPGDRSSFENALRKFKMLFQRERVVGKLKERSHYEKPSEKKRRKKREAYERRLLTEARERMMASGEWEKRQKRKAKRRQQKLEQRLRQQDTAEDLES
jgi:small subunit ribosomal protein S21